MSPVIDISRITVGTLSGAPILTDLSWRVNKGEHWVILGPNGSGKTTLLSALTGYLNETSALMPAGYIRLLGEAYGDTDWRALRKKIGIVGASVRNKIGDENPAIGVVASGKDALLFIWEDLSAAEIKEARRLLALTECAGLEDRLWAVLSQGERQRVLIARALMAKPKLLILDEPCAGLDPVARENFLGFVARLARAPDAPTLILVTHHVEEILPCFTHALCLRAGTVIASGETAAVLTTANLRKTLGPAVTLRKNSGRYALSVKSNDAVAA
jgi:iron complex transport system ATP-binding protein